MSPENSNSSGNQHNEDFDAQSSSNETVDTSENVETNRKLGSSALVNATGKRIKPEGAELNKIIRADDEVSRELNEKTVQDYLTDVGINPNLADTLLSSGVFDVTGNTADYRVSLWYKKDDSEQPYIESTIRDMAGHRNQSGHKYRIFECDGFLVAHDAETRYEEKHYVMDEMPSDEEIRYSTYKNEKARVSLIEPNSGKPVVLGEYGHEKLDKLPPARGLNDTLSKDNFAQYLYKFQFQIIDQEKFDELASGQMKDNPIIEGIEESIAKQKEEAKKEKEAAEKEKMAKVERGGSFASLIRKIRKSQP